MRGCPSDACYEFWRKGACSKTPCRFQHVPCTSIASEVKEPCRGFAAGMCRRGDRCRYLHAPNTTDAARAGAEGASSGTSPAAVYATHVSAVARPDGAHAAIRVTVVPDTYGMNILSPYSLWPFGWEVCYSGSSNGSTWEVPGVRTYQLRLTPGKAHAHIDLVKVPAGVGHPAGVTIYDPACPAHTSLRQYSFIVDTGAESSLVTHKDRDILTRGGGFAGVTVMGIGGKVNPLGGGVLDFVFPGSRVKPIVNGPAPVAATSTTVMWCNEVPEPGRVAFVRIDPDAPSDEPGPEKAIRRREAQGTLATPQMLADNLNIFGHEQLRHFGAVVDGVLAGAKVITGRDYSAGLLQRALGRTAPAHHRLNLAAWHIRERLLPGEQWWADIGHRHDPDYQGNEYMRLFAEEKTGYAVPLFCVDKTTASLVTQLEAMELWVRLNVPHGNFRLLRCDFGTEYATQGHGANYLVAGLQAFIAGRPYFRVIPCPPHAHAFNKAENTIHQVTGHAFANACRARLGPAAWSLLDEGACYQHNCRPVWRPADAPSGDTPLLSRMEALTGRRPDVSAMVGFVGQAGWARKWDGKASAQRDNAAPVIYICPSPSGAGQVVYNLETHTKQLVYSLAVTTDPNACSLMLAQSALARPRGAYGTPEADAYTECLRAMVQPRSHEESTMVMHDPVTGMPATLYRVQPHVGPDGELLMYPEGGLPDIGDPDDSTPAPGARAPGPGAEAPGVEGDDSDLPADGGSAGAEAPGDDGSLPPGLPRGAVRWVKGTPYQGATEVRNLPRDTRIWYVHGIKKGATDSAMRYAQYQMAGTIEESLRRNPDPKKRQADLRFDLEHGHCWILPPTGAYYTEWFAATNMGKMYATHHGPVPGNECPTPARAYKAGAPREPSLEGPEPWTLREHTMWRGAEEIKEEAAELQRIIALEEGPPQLTADSSAEQRREAAHFAEYQHMLSGDSRRLTKCYGDGAARARAAVLEDERERPRGMWAKDATSTVPPFDAAYDIHPCVVMFADSEPNLVPPRSVAAAKKLPEYADPGDHQRGHGADNQDGPRRQRAGGGGQQQVPHLHL